MKITKCQIGPFPKNLLDVNNMPRVRVTYENGTEEDLFWYYPDEQTYNESEFIGLTREDAFRLRYSKISEYWNNEE